MPELPDEKKLPEEQLTSEDNKKFSNMVKFLSRAFVQTQTFGIDHPLAKQPIEQCFILLHNLIEEKGEIVLYIAEKKLRYGQTILERRNPVVDRMITLFSLVQLVSLGFERGFSREDFLRLLSVFAVKPEDILAGGGVEKLVNQKNVGHLQLNPIKYELIGQDEKVVTEDATAAEEALKELQRQLAEKEAKEEKEKPEELLSLIDESLKEDADQSLFTDKLTENPLEVVNLITEAIRMLNKVGGENAKPILSSIVNKLALVGDDLYRCLREGKDQDKAVKQTYKAAGILGKELTKKIQDIQVAPDLNSLVEEMANVLSVLLDQIEAQKMLSVFGKGEINLTKKVNFLKKIMQREKSSPEFGLLMRKLLVIKGMSEEEIKNLIDRKVEILEEAEKEKEGSLTQDLSSTLQKFKDGQLGIDEALAKLKEVLKKTKKLK